MPRYAAKGPSSGAGASEAAKLHFGDAGRVYVECSTSEEAHQQPKDDVTSVFYRSIGLTVRPAHAALVVTAGMAVALCSGCGSTDTAATSSDTPSSSAVIGSPTPASMPACNVGRRDPPDITSEFVDHLPRHFAVKEICAADVGPGLAGADVAELSDLAAGEVTETYSSPDSEQLKALVGTVKSGNGDAFVDAFLSRVGEVRDDTVTLGGRTVRYFNTPGGEGYADAEGPTVFIGYLPPNASMDATQEIGKELFTRILLAATGAPVPADDLTHPKNGTDSYSPGRGAYTTPGDPGWVFFKTETVKGIPGYACGIGPNGTVAGCDFVPTSDAPSGTNQTIVEGSAPAHYAHSETPTFTRDVGVLLPGHRVDNGNATCGVGYQGTVHCTIGEHSFVVSSSYGVLE